jgi:GcrA cell cycle regulator
MRTDMWPDEHIERLKVHWAARLSASQTAAALARDFRSARYSRAAVIGKVHRLGLGGRLKPSAPMKVAAVGVRSQARVFGETKVKPAKVPMPKGVFVLPPMNGAGSSPHTNPAALPKAVFAPEGPGQRTVMTVRPFECRWPIGDPADPGFTLCGRPGCVGPYCAAHKVVGTLPTSKPHQLIRSLRRWAA